MPAFLAPAPLPRARVLGGGAPRCAPRRGGRVSVAVLRHDGRAASLRQQDGGGAREAEVSAGREGGMERAGRAHGGRRVYLVGGIGIKHETVKVEEVPVETGGGLFGIQAKAYWESMGMLPLSFAAFGVTALAVKMAKVKTGQWKAGDGGVNRATTHESIVTSEEELAQLHVFKCSGCGYEMYPARGREFKHFGDKFKCPLCGTGKDGFWDLNDPDDPRNQEEEEDEEDEEDDGEEGGGGGSGVDGGGGGIAAEIGRPSAVVGEAEEA